MSPTDFLTALRARPTMYLGSDDPLARTHRIVLEALWAMWVDAGSVGTALAYLGTEGQFVIVGHKVGATPLGRANATAEWMDLAMTTVGAHAEAAGLLPWSKWTGLPLVNAYCFELFVRCTTPAGVVTFQYRNGSRCAVEEMSLKSGDDTRGVELRFCLNSEIVGAVDRIGSVVDRVFDSLSAEDAARVERRDPKQG